MQLNRRLVYILFASLSLALFLAAAIIKFHYPNDPSGELISDILKDVGIVVGAVALINILWNIFGGEPLTEQIDQLKQLNILMRDADNSGLAGVFARAADVKSDQWLSLIQNSKSHIDISGHTLYEISDSEQLCKALLERVKSGVNVRLLINYENHDLS